jgi:subfamily B ATP-binding cassette protein HlyB/CyaB
MPELQLDMPNEPYALTPSRENTGNGKIDLIGISFRYSEHHPWLYGCDSN